MLTSPCNVDPITPHFYIVKLGFTGVYTFCPIFALKHRLWVLNEVVLMCTHDLCRLWVLVRTASMRPF